MRTRILIVEDEADMRRAFHLLLSRTELEVVGEAADGREALRVAAEVRPDVVVTDLWMARLNGWDAIRLLREARPETRAVAVSALDGAFAVYRALEAGAAGFVSKYSMPTELAAGLEAVARGGSFFCSRIGGEPLRQAHAWQQDPASAPKDPLTLPERLVLQLWVEDYSVGDSAKNLGKSVKTVESHRAHIMRKLGMRDRRELWRYAVERHIARPRDLEWEIVMGGW
ncbi:MAG TPA: response regulator transcription factor [Polyangia bacterium]|jgi:DNA-binding NarL/FixJ family response regulator